MLYRTEPCEHGKYLCCMDRMIEDGVEPIGKIDWYDPTAYGMLRYYDLECAERYREKWQKAYAARGWEFK